LPVNKLFVLFNKLFAVPFNILFPIIGLFVFAGGVVGLFVVVAEGI
jgi:hypothetical protein